MSDATRIRLPEAIDPGTLRSLAAEMEAATGDPRAPIVLHGGPETFCRGLNLVGLDDPAARAEATDRFIDLILQIRRSGRVHVAVVEGAALGGGVGLAAACDVVIASRNATFGLPEALVGLAPLTIWPILRERMTSQGIRRMVLTGLAQTAEEAEKLGLVDEVVAPDEVERALAAWLRASRRTRPEGIAALKRHSAGEDDLEGALRRGAHRLQELLANSDALKLARDWEQGIAPWSDA